MIDWLTRKFVKNSEDTKNPQVRTAYGRLAGIVGIVCNLLLFAAKILAGILAGSISIMADAVNNLSDAASSVVTLIGFKLAAKPADKEHPFGHARFEYIAGLAVAVMVLIIGVELGQTSIKKIVNPTELSYSFVSFAVLIASIILKLWMAAFNRKIGNKIASRTLEATYADSRNDAITTSAVLVTAVVAKFTGLMLDGWVGFCVAAFILWSGISLVKDTLSPLLGEAPSLELVKRVSDKISSYDGVLGTHDLMVHDYGPGRRFASAHVEMASEVDVLVSHEIIDNIERDFLEREGIHLIIHYDPVVTDDSVVSLARNHAIFCIESINKGLSLHDFRLVEGPTHTNYIFDVVVPPEFIMPTKELCEMIEKLLQNGGKEIHTVITVDDSYAPVHI